MKNKNLIAVTNLLRCLSLDDLRNPGVVANLVRAFGIVQWGPPVFGDEEIFKNPDAETVGIYQTPTQIAPALVYLSEFKTKSYLEIGVFQGGNFLFVSEYLKRFNPSIQCLGIDPTGYLNPKVREIIELSDWMRFASVTSNQIAGRKFDLVFIDGDHSKEWVEADYNNVGRHAKICMIHDINEESCPDVAAFWKGLSGDKIEFIETPSGRPLQGIGIVKKGKE